MRRIVRSTVAGVAAVAVAVGGLAFAASDGTDASPAAAAGPFRAGQALAWGYTTASQPGYVHELPAEIPTLSDDAVIEQVESVALAGPANILALSEGRVHSLGANSQGLLNVPAEFRDGSTRVASIAMGGNNAGAVTTTGTVKVWGGTRGGATSFPPALQGRVAKIAWGNGFGLALTTDGEVRSWGTNAGLADLVPAGLQDIQDIQAGPTVGAAQRADGTWVQWGDGARPVPEGHENEKWRSFAAGRAGIAADGEVVVFSTDPQDAYPDPELEGTPVQIVSRGNSGYLLRTDRGEVFGWGANSTQAGAVAVPEVLRGATVVELSGGDSGFVALMGDSAQEPVLEVVERPTISGSPQVGETLEVTPAVFSDDTATLSHQWLAGGEPIEGATDVRLTLTEAHLGAEITVRTTGIVDGQDPVSSVSDPVGPVTPADSGEPLPVAEGGELAAWGTLGRAGAWSRLVDEAPDGSPISDAAASAMRDTVLASEEGSVSVDNPRDPASELAPPAALEDETVVRTFATTSAAGALTSDKRLFVWGASAGSVTDVPAAIQGSVVDAVLGNNYAAALLDDGTVEVWGSSSTGVRTVPDGLADVTSLSGGFDHLMALTEDGDVTVWGGNNFGQAIKPARVDDATIVTIASAAYHNVVFADDGTAYQWGQTGTQGIDAFPADEVDGDVTMVDGGVYHYVAATDAGEVVTWGASRRSDHGDLTTMPTDVTEVLDGAEVLAVDAGQQHSTVIYEPGAPPVTVEDQPSIAGEPRVGQTLTATPATFGETEGVTLTHRWFADDEVVEGATGTTLTLTADHEGATISYETTATRTSDGGEATSDRSNELGPVLPAELVITGQPTITGQPYVGETLTVTPAEVSDERAESTFQWFAGSGDDYEPIDGATGRTLEVTGSLRGDRVKVVQTATRAIDEASETAESAPTGVVTDAPVDLTVASEARISGTPRVGQTLTGTPATFSTTDGVTVKSSWVIGTDEVAADGTTLTLTNDHVRKNIQFKTVATRGDETVSSVSGTVGPVLVVLAATADPTISGTPQAGRTLTGTPATFNDTQGVTVAHQWLADGDAIAGATSTTITLTEAEVGKAITFRSVATRGDDTADAVSEPTGDVRPAAITVTTKPTITGTATVGETLTGVAAVFSATEGVTVTSRWLADGEPIEGATGRTLELTGDHLGAKITFASTATRGDETVESVSDATAAVAPAGDPGEPGGSEDLEGEIEILGDNTVDPGETIEVLVGEEWAGEEVTVVMFSTPRTLGTFTVPADGIIEVTIPGDAEPGEHRLAVYDADGELIGWETFVVAGAAAGPGGGDGGPGGVVGALLPDTGAMAPAILAPLGLLLLVAGAVTVGHRRRTVGREG